MAVETVLQEMSSLVPVTPFLHFHAGIPIDGGGGGGGRKISSILKEKCLHFPFVCLILFETCHMYVPLLFKFASSVLLWETGFERTHLSYEKFPCVRFNE